LPLAQSKEAKPIIKALTTIALLLALDAVAFAKQTPVERPRFVFVNADINTGSAGAMRENIGSIGAISGQTIAGQSPAMSALVRTSAGAVGTTTRIGNPHLLACSIAGNSDGPES
jgi:hypothetical protein